MSVADDDVDSTPADIETAPPHDFSALDEQDYVHMTPDLESELPQMVIQIGLMSKRGGYNGEDIHAAMKDVDLQYGDMGIYHRYQAKPGRVIAGFYDGEPMARRLVRDGKKLLIVASNRHYPPIPFEEDKWNHQGVVVYAVRELGSRYTGES